MSELYGTLVPVLASITALAVTAVGYLLYRQKEIISLAKEVLTLVSVIKESYEDKNISEEEYSKIIREINDVAVGLKDVVYKK